MGRDDLYIPALRRGKDALPEPRQIMTHLPLILFQLVVISWTAYAYMEGTREAWMWYQKWTRRLEVRFPVKDEHHLFLAQRAIVWVMTFGCFYGLARGLELSIWWAVLENIVIAFIFLPIHQGAYYQTRRDLSPDTYIEGFWDHAKNSTRWSTKFFDGDTRFVMLLFGVISHLAITIAYVSYIYG